MYNLNETHTHTHPVRLCHKSITSKHCLVSQCGVIEAESLRWLRHVWRCVLRFSVTHSCHAKGTPVTYPVTIVVIPFLEWKIYLLAKKRLGNETIDFKITSLPLRKFIWVIGVCVWTSPLLGPSHCPISRLVPVESEVQMSTSFWSGLTCDGIVLGPWTGDLSFNQLITIFQIRHESKIYHHRSLLPILFYWIVNDRSLW